MSFSPPPPPPPPPDDVLRPEYTDVQLRNALRDYYDTSSSPDEACRHILGYADPTHEMSTLQRITATIILDLNGRLLLRDDASSSSSSSSPAKSSPSIDELLETAKSFRASHGPTLNLPDAIRDESPRMALAAEFKRRSPSKGLIAPPNLRAGEQAALYAEAGASVISVLTEGRWFGGSLADLTEARLAYRPPPRMGGGSGSRRRPAILRKDFVFSEYQIAEASAHGADSVLLIVATTPSDVLGRLINYARYVVGMEPLVEVHAPDELDVALRAGARVIGVNNRNLHTFQLDLGVAERVAGELARRGLGYRHDDDDVVVAGGDDDDDDDDGGGGQRGRRISLCALSGMSTSHDVDRYRRAGVGMCLIGESLMRSADPMAAIRGLCLDPADYIRASSSDGSGGGAGAGGAYVAGTRIVKVCGVTNPVDAVEACRAGANLIGVIFAEKSGRRVTSFDAAAEIVNAVRGFGERSDRIALVVDDDDNEGRSSRVGADAVPALVARARELERVASSRRPLVVGVFQNQDPGYVKDAVEKCGLDMVQLHGSEGMAASNWRNFGVPALRVVDIELGAPDDDGDGGGGGGRAAGGSSSSSSPSDVIASAILGRLTSDPFAILLDTSIKGGGGGTGRAFDWTIAESIQNMGLPVMIAGGLNPENVGEAVGGVRPWGVDVAGGVEVRPGVKDHDKVRRFVSGARTAAAEADKGF